MCGDGIERKETVWEVLLDERLGDTLVLFCSGECVNFGLASWISLFKVRGQCSERLCKKDAKEGAHIYTDDGNYFIIPMCKKHHSVHHNECQVEISGDTRAYEIFDNECKEEDV